MAFQRNYNFIQNLMGAGGGNALSGLQRTGEANRLANLLKQQQANQNQLLNPLQIQQARMQVANQAAQAANSPLQRDLLKAQIEGAKNPRNQTMETLQSKISLAVGKPWEQLTPEEKKEGFGIVSGKAPTEADTLALENARLKNQQLKAEMTQTETKTAEDKQQGIEFKQRALDIVGDLLGDRKGLSGAVGTIYGRLPSIQEETVNWENKLTTLKDMLTKENLGLLKGVMSDKDIEMLRNIASGELQLVGGEQAMIDELARLQGVLSSDITKAGGTPSVKQNEAMANLPQGTVDNGDGTFTLPTGERVRPRK